jgi:hypothetical protein
MKQIEDTMLSAEQNKLTREKVESILDEVLEGFHLTQPSPYFLTNPTDDTECKI